MAKERLILGVHCGAACDGVDAALVAVSGKGEKMTARLVAHLVRPIAPELRTALSAAVVGSDGASAALDCELGAAMAAAAGDLLKQAKVDAATLLGAGASGPALPAACADESPAGFEVGNPAMLARHLARPVAAGFERAVASLGAPLRVAASQWPHWLLFRHERLSRVVVQLGGVARLTFIPADAAFGDCITQDAAPCGILLDALSQELLKETTDADGAAASRGRVHAVLLHELIASGEQSRRHGVESTKEKPLLLTPHSPLPTNIFVQRLLMMARKHRCDAPADILATATELVARGIVACIATLTERPHEVILTGGGSLNIHLAGRIRSLQSPSSTVSCEKFGFAARSLGAVAAALLAAARLDEIPLPFPSADGELKPAVVGGLFV